MFTQVFVCQFPGMEKKMVFFSKQSTKDVSSASTHTHTRITMVIEIGGCCKHTPNIICFTTKFVSKQVCRVPIQKQISVANERLISIHLVHTTLLRQIKEKLVINCQMLDARAIDDKFYGSFRARTGPDSDPVTKDFVAVGRSPS